MENRFWKIFVNFLIVIGLLACAQSEDSIIIVDIGENDLVFDITHLGNPEQVSLYLNNKVPAKITRIGHQTELKIANTF